jgi:hypothetical protein
MRTHTTLDASMAMKFRRAREAKRNFGPRTKSKRSILAVKWTRKRLFNSILTRPAAAHARQRKEIKGSLVERSLG